MAWLDNRGDDYRLVFQIGGQPGLKSREADNSADWCCGAGVFRCRQAILQ